MSADTALVAAINRLRQDRNAVILAHYYQEPRFRTSPILWAIPWSYRDKPPAPVRM